MASHTLRVAAAQIESVPNDLDANLAKHLDAIDAARAGGVDVLLFPELSLSGHSSGAHAARLAIDVAHPYGLTLARASGSMVTLFGAIERGDGNVFYNAVLAVRDGAVLHVHRKVNLATYGRLDDGHHFAIGARIDTFALDHDWRMAPMICADTWNPPLVHLAALQGATLMPVAASSALEAVGDDFDNPSGWAVNLRFHALTYGLPTVMANRVGIENGLTFWGGSRVVDPFGQTVAIAEGRTEQLVAASIDRAQVRRARELLPTIRDTNIALIMSETSRIMNGFRRDSNDPDREAGQRQQDGRTT